ncbi:TPA: hypothetical protein MIP48_04970 [Klebsiella pneumoniae]|nr:hypothetical protein CVG30_25995 [Klebsiella pneumoniae subsp. pneumoniae]MBL3001394.1 hypothetical protein [Klebsiella pneumoniae]MVW99579.1 hypothetical protein [Klebsiella pneumoniae]OVT70858.1 hypothetical protein BME91_12685 [Klebsiella pneumoniae]OVU01210.1 hypothetical protein BMD98_11670 [Klebsiella pneumoniae]
MHGPLLFCTPDHILPAPSFTLSIKQRNFTLQKRECPPEKTQIKKQIQNKILTKWCVAALFLTYCAVFF